MTDLGWGRTHALGGLACMAMAAGAPESAGADVAYGYDSLGRLANAVYSDGTTIVYSYDAAGNRAFVTIGTCSTGCVPTAGATSTTVAPNTMNNPVASSLGGSPATSVTITTGPAHGTSFANGLCFNYTPSNNYAGSDSFKYKASNADGASTPATASVNVVAGAPPIARPDSLKITKFINPGETYCPSGTVDVTANDSSPQHYPLTVTSVTNGTFGKGTVFDDSSITYTANACYKNAISLSDSVTYTISDGHLGTDSAAVAVTVDVETKE